MKIAVVSDLHIGPGAKAQDLCPLECVKKKDHCVESSDGFVSAFLKFISSNNLTADYLLVCGDITDDAHPMEVKMASSFLRQIREKLSVPDCHSVFVPGNHDSDWTFYDPTDKTGIKWSQRYLAFRSSQFIFKDINLNQGVQGDLFSNNYFKVWTIEDLVVLGYNSASTDNRDVTPHCGEIVQGHLSAIRNQLNTVFQRDDSRLKICIVHHHLRNIPLPKPSNRDYSVAINGESLISLLQDLKFDFIIHGHRHHSYFDAMHNPIPILAAGSLSALLGTEMTELTSNQFHMIDIERDAHGNAVGTVKSWSHKAGLWMPSEENRDTRCLGHIRSFGYTLSDPNMRNRVLAAFGSIMNAHPSYFKWNDSIVACCPEAGHVIEDQEMIAEWCNNNVSTKFNVEVMQLKNGDIAFLVK